MRLFDFNRVRLKWKVFAFLLGFCALLLVVLWLSQTVFLNDIYKFIRTQELNQAISLVEREINSPDLEEILTNLEEEHGIYVGLTADFVPPIRDRGPALTDQRTSPIETITEVRVFLLENGRTLSLTFFAIIVPVNATVTTLQYQLYAISGIMVLLSIVLALIIAKRVSKPIEQINKNALTLAKGDYDVRFSGKGFHEIVTLSDTLNTAAVELGRVEALRRELLANVSHDMRTPLALVYSYAEMMQDFPGEISPEQMRVIMDETRRLTMLVNDALDVSKLESEGDTLSISNFNLTVSISEAIERMQALLGHDGFEIAFDHDKDVYVDADKTKLSRVFYNLLINAVNYSGDNRSIMVAQELYGDRVRVLVTDQGQGIQEADLPYIWERYYKSAQMHKRSVAGTGLGLSISKKIIEKHGGSYGVISEVDKGSTFWFEVPLVQVLR